MANIAEEAWQTFGKMKWTAAINYDVGDIVQYKSQLWAALTQNTNSEPNIESSDWKVYIQKSEIQFWGRFTGIFIPLYVYPANIFTNPDWNNVIDLAKTYKEVPTMAAVNPGNGPGTVVDGNYAAGIERLQGANIFVLGYVSCEYGARDINLVKADVDRWKALYPKTQGIFFDEQSYDPTPQNIAYFEAISDYAKNKGFTYVMNNPGSTVPGDWFENEVADSIITHENSTYPTVSDAKGDWDGGNADYNLNKRVALVHSQTFDLAQLTMMKKYYGWIYITHDVLPNPWDSIGNELETLYKNLMPIGKSFQDALTISTVAPTAVDGNDGDIWFVTEA